MDNPMSGILASISNVLAPGLADAKASAQDAADSLNLAFQTLIAEGVVVIALLVVIAIRAGRK